MPFLSEVVYVYAVISLFPGREALKQHRYSIRLMFVCACRFHSLIWTAFDADGKHPSGRLIGGSENGALTIFSPDSILSSGDDAVIGQANKHTGPVRALDYNRFQVTFRANLSFKSDLSAAENKHTRVSVFQSNLIASGANDSEIYIWDMNSFSNPMTPGAKSQVVITHIWNYNISSHVLFVLSCDGK